MPLALRVLCFILFAVQVAYGAPSNPIVFVTQPPHPMDFATVNATFGNQRAPLDSVPRGGDLYIRYANGALKNLTQAAGFGNAGFQGANGIAVRDPAVHSSGQKLLFSMVIGAPTQRYQVQEYRWQIYEMTGLGPSDAPVVTKVANQPEGYNNVMPEYASGGGILFVTDRPRNGAAHLYPQLDEYESTATNTGLWFLSASGDLALLDHAPSGAFDPFVDSFGRVIYTRWDHFQKDQQRNLDYFKVFNYASEAADAQRINTKAEAFPEQQSPLDPEYDATKEIHRFNHFFPWMINQNGTEHETLNHIGRHELHGYINRAVRGDPNIIEYYGQYSRTNQNSILNMFQIHESPTVAGRYFGVDAPEFGTHAAGCVVSIDAPPSKRAGQMVVNRVTHSDTCNTDDTPSSNHAGLFRDPLPLTNGELLSSWANTSQQDSNIGSGAAPASKYAFRLTNMALNGGVFKPTGLLTPGVVKSVSYWSPDELINYNNVTMWELQAVEVVSYSQAPAIEAALPAPEKAVFDKVGVNVEEFREYLRSHNIALIVSRNVTARDSSDLQQPFNLRVRNTSTSSVAASGTVYTISSQQMLQADQIRGYGGVEDPRPGRRILAQPMHDAMQFNPANPDGPAGSVRIGDDGSVAAFVPARRALSWHLTDPAGEPVVRERYWLTFQPGEVRVCASCHGLSDQDQLGRQEPTNQPKALEDLLNYFKGLPPMPPDDGGTPPPAPEAKPSFGLRIEKISKRLSKTKIAAGETVRLRGDGKNAASKSISVSLQAKVGSLSCGTLGTLKSSSSGKFSAKVLMPNRKKGGRVVLSLHRAGAKVGEAAATVGKGKGRERKCPKLIK